MNQDFKDGSCQWDDSLTRGRLTLADRQSIIQQIDICVLDEGALCDREVWLILIARLREAPARAWVCTTPRGFDWLWETFVKDANPDYAVIRSSTRDNIYLPKDFVTRLEEQYSST